ncbi:glycosyltransferase family 4 protein [Salinimicrobium tongyeongense]|uniref:Glycosyltransferase family 4 protein n=1 Tax=Salinimicrobium tongyeongense TaxID=2809707 RepID=A0ABY6NSH2_9FLAO|nr:glycosyltransferase family 4 protein [Salinimicrobium tongyeongense]UZH55503.1 glycosyltransferase family 4 protein [Salinimicrobium tongyeongense]
MFKIIRVSTIPLSLNVLLKGQLSYLSNNYRIIAISGKGKDLDEVAQREQVPTVAIEMQRNINIVKDLKSLWQLYRYFKKENPHIVHSITPKAGLLSMAAGYFAGVPVRIHTFTGLVFPSKKGAFKKLLIFMDRSLCAFATHVYPEGEGVKQDLIRYKITFKPLKVLANGNVNGINTSHFNPDAITPREKELLSEKLGITSKDFVFVFVGRLVGDKGINELVTAFKNLLNSNLQKLGEEQFTPKLLLVGPFESEFDPLEPKTLQEIQDNPNILSVGFQADVRPYFAISNVLVFPSYREGFPNVVMQAGAMGLPAIVTNINGCNEIIINEINGLIIPPKNIAKLEEAMRRVLFDEDLRNELRSEARLKIINRYKQEMVWEAIRQEYQKLIKTIE